MGVMLKKNFASLHSKSTNLYELTDDDIRDMHKILLSVYKDLKVVCDKYDLKMIAVGGTGLGAIRHKGFIPWDDDMDLAMTRADFMKFRTIFRKELGDRYYLLSPGSQDGVNCFVHRVMKKGTTMLNMIDEASPYPHGIYVDFTTLDYVPHNRLEAMLKGIAADIIRFISYSVYWYQYPSPSLREHMMGSEGKNYYRLRMAVGRFFSLKKSEWWFGYFDEFIRGRKSDVFTFAAGRKKYKGEQLKVMACLPLKKAMFEDTEIYVFNDQEGYLTQLYGDYMKIPPVKDRERHLCLRLDFEKEV